MKLDQSVVQSRLALCAAALAGSAAAASSADAAIVTFTTPVGSFNGVIPENVSGVYIDLATGATGTSGFTGWDFNPYRSNGGTQLGFYWAATAGGVGTTSATGPYIDLSGGGIVGPGSTVTRSINGTTGTPFHTTGLHVLGFSFFNEATSATNFGYMVIENLGPNTTPGYASTIRSWSFDDTGAEIVVPAIPAPAALAPLSMAALAFGARRNRRQTVA